MNAPKLLLVAMLGEGGMGSLNLDFCVIFMKVEILGGRYQTLPLVPLSSFLRWYRFFSKVFNLEAIGWEDHLVSFYTLIIACQGHISIVTAIFEFSNGCLKFCLKLSFTNLTIQAIMAILNKKMILVNKVI